MGHQVFISYASEKGSYPISKDRLVAEKICAALESIGIRCWMAHRDILPGEDWLNKMIDAIMQCQIVILVFSANANRSSWVVQEVTRALRENITIIPFRIENVFPMRGLRALDDRCQWMDAYTFPLEKHLDKLVEVVRSHLPAKHAIDVVPIPVKTKQQEEIKYSKDHIKSAAKKSLDTKQEYSGVDKKKRFQRIEGGPQKFKIVPERKRKSLLEQKWILLLGVPIIIFVLVSLGSLFKDGKKSVPKEDLSSKKFEHSEKKKGSLDEKGANSQLNDEEKFKKYLNLATMYLKNGHVKKAREYLNLAQRINVTKETKNLDKKIKNSEFEMYFSAAKHNYLMENYEEALACILNCQKIEVTNDLRELDKRTRKKINEKQAILDNERKRNLEMREEQEYKSALAVNTIHSFQNYISKYPTGKYFFEAQKKIEKLKKIPEDVRAIKSKGIKVRKNKNGYWEASFAGDIIMVYIPGGDFIRGSRDRKFDEKPQRKVCLDGYWMGKTEVSNEQFVKFLNNLGKNHYNGCFGHPCIYIKDAYSTKSKTLYSQIKFNKGNYYIDPFYRKHPAIEVSWYGAKAFCEWLSKGTGLKFKLPTEAQWEKASRGKDARRYPWGDEEPNINLANFNFNNNAPKTSPVTSYPQGASPYGLLNMAGNVWEWCHDWYDSYYYLSSWTYCNPKGPRKGLGRVLRGGGCLSDAKSIRCSNRVFGGISISHSFVGFRLCMTNR